MVEFVKEHIIYRFGIPQTITTDQGAQFVSLEFREFAESMGMKLFNSSPYYAQANGQAEAFNKIMIKLIQKEIDQKPKRWHSVLNEALWAYRMAPHGATKTSPYELVYGHHVVLPWEMQSNSRRVVLQKDLSSKYYSGLMMDELEDLHMIRLRALENIEKNKLRVTTRKWKSANLQKGIWFGKLYCRLEPNTVHSANGPQTGRDLFGWSDACPVIPTC
jgi:hypothetical protein